MRAILAWGLVIGFWGAIVTPSRATATPTIQSVEIKPGNSPEVVYRFSETPNLPEVRVEENFIELTYKDISVPEHVRNELEKLPPNSLVKRVSLYSPQPGLVKSRIIVNGTPELLGDRSHLHKNGREVSLLIDFPRADTSSSSLRALAAEEEKPFSLDAAKTTPLENRSNHFQLLLICLFLIAAGVGTYFVLKLVKNRARSFGSRKYLVEQLSYCPLNPKSGVSLLRIGNEFVLVGVTQTQINFLSNLSRLQDRYEQESELERKDFKVAVEEEMQRLKKNRVAST